MELYRPSSGTEGEFFINHWCRQCKRDMAQNGTKPFDECKPEDICRILGDTMFYEVYESGYPKQWINDPKHGPCCTAFVGMDDELWPLDRDTMTIDMFDETTETAA